MKNNIEKLLAANISNYRISKDTGISQPLLAKYSNGLSDIDNMTLGNATKLNKYYIKYKGDIKMENIIATLQSNFFVDGQDEKYGTMYINKEELLGEIEKEIFEDNFSINLNELNFPIITFDSAGVTGGWVFDNKATREDIMFCANEYFQEKKESYMWYFEDYTVYEETDLLRFEDNEGDLLGYVDLNDDDLINELHEGIDPINEGWEDGMGNTINIDGWGNEED